MPAPNYVRDQLEGEIRYSIRLTSRTARLYRRLQTFGFVLAILSGSAAAAMFFATQMPNWLTLLGGGLCAFTTAALIAIRPGDKAAQNETDITRYRVLMYNAVGMSVTKLRAAIREAHKSNAPEIESLRDIAYNDVLRERGQADSMIPLSPIQKMLKFIA